MSRETFLNRVRQAAQVGQAYRVHLRDLPDDVGYVGAAGDLCTAMAKQVQDVGGSSHVVDDWDAARQKLIDILQEHDVQSALCWQHDVLRELQLNRLLDSAGVTADDYHSLTSREPSEQRKQMLNADIGISSADRAIAETGTLLVRSQPGQERVATLLPPVHVAIITAQQIVPDLFDAVQFDCTTESGQLPSNITLITGPSKTGDIELQLTTGVHGPGAWYVVIIRDRPHERRE